MIKIKLSLAPVICTEDLSHLSLSLSAVSIIYRRNFFPNKSKLSLIAQKKRDIFSTINLLLLEKNTIFFFLFSQNKMSLDLKRDIKIKSRRRY